jgi:hypothetical protein
MLDTQEIKTAQRLVRTIASDIMLYNREKVVSGLKSDQLFEVLAEELKEAQDLYESKVSEDIRSRYALLDRAIVDVLIRTQAHMECPLW